MNIIINFAVDWEEVQKGRKLRVAGCKHPPTGALRQMPGDAGISAVFSAGYRIVFNFRK